MTTHRILHLLPLTPLQPLLVLPLLLVHNLRSNAGIVQPPPPVQPRENRYLLLPSSDGRRESVGGKSGGSLRAKEFGVVLSFQGRSGGEVEEFGFEDAGLKLVELALRQHRLRIGSGGGSRGRSRVGVEDDALA
jgi:hypothetical protein